MKITPKQMKRLLNIYPPYLFAGIKVNFIREDWKELHVSMSLHWYNRNAVGTHFGGSLYSMVDPHLMLMLMQLLGNEFVVWDKAAEIDFIKATKKKVSSIIKISDDELSLINRNTENGKKYLAEFKLEIKNESGELIATVKKIIYIRRKHNSL